MTTGERRACGDRRHVGAVVAVGRVGAVLTGVCAVLRGGPVGTVGVHRSAGFGYHAAGERGVVVVHATVDDRDLLCSDRAPTPSVATGAGGVEQVGVDDPGRAVEGRGGEPVLGDRGHPGVGDQSVEAGAGHPVGRERVDLDPAELAGTATGHPLRKRVECPGHVGLLGLAGARGETARWGHRHVDPCPPVGSDGLADPGDLALRDAVRVDERDEGLFGCGGPLARNVGPEVTGRLGERLVRRNCGLLPVPALRVTVTTAVWAVRPLLGVRRRCLVVAGAAVRRRSLRGQGCRPCHREERRQQSNGDETGSPDSPHKELLPCWERFSESNSGC